MQDFCPLCLKNGWKSKLKLFQINLDEAMLSCETEDCIWPFGYENISYFSRKVGKTWSYHWDDFVAKPQNQQEINNQKPIQEKSIFAPVDDEVSAETKDFVPIASEHSYHTLKSNQENSGPPTTIDKKLVKEIEIVCEEKVEFVPKPMNKNSNKESTIDPESCTKNKTPPKCTSQSTGNTRELPQITSIEKTNIDISNLLTDNPISTISHCDEVKPIECKKPVKCIKVELPSKQIQKPPTQVPIMISCPKLPQKKPFTPKKLVNFVKPISYPKLQPQQKQSITPQTDNNVSASNSAKKSSLKALKAEIIQSRRLQPIKKLSSGKEYQKFSFSVIKKQMENKDQHKEPEKSLDKAEMTSNNILSTEIQKNESNTKEFALPDNAPSLNAISQMDADTRRMTLNETSFSDCSLNSTFDNSSASIDIVLDDLLNKDHSMSENINDDWITSLLD